MKPMLRLAPVLALLSIPQAGFSAPAGQLQVKKTMTLVATPSEVWSRVGDFCGIGKWHPAVAKCEIVSGTENKVGAVRVITTRDGAVFRERLLARSPATHSLRYNILESPLPVTAYVATLHVSKAPSGGSLVEWTGTFRSPKDKQEAAVKALEGIFQAGLDNLKATEPAK
jgi:mxaD protein